jgi:hypothetical protein
VPEEESEHVFLRAVTAAPQLLSMPNSLRIVTAREMALSLQPPSSANGAYQIGPATARRLADGNDDELDSPQPV